MVDTQLGRSGILMKQRKLGLSQVFRWIPCHQPEICQLSCLDEKIIPLKSQKNLRSPTGPKLGVFSSVNSASAGSWLDSEPEGILFARVCQTINAWIAKSRCHDDSYSFTYLHFCQWDHNHIINFLLLFRPLTRHVKSLKPRIRRVDGQR